MLSITLVSQFILFSLITSSWHVPFNQLAPLYYNKTIADIPKGGSNLLVSNPNANFIRDLYSLADKGGFKNGTPIIDLTGRLPAVAYLLRGLASETPWLLSQYSGSNKYFIMLMKRIPCDLLENSWIFYDKNNVFNNYNIDVINSAGIDLNNYINIGSVKGNLNVRDVISSSDITILKPDKYAKSRTQFCLKARSRRDSRVRFFL
jgi:hypothetical protein